MPRASAPLATPAAAPLQPVHSQAAMHPMQPVSDERSSTVTMASNVLFYSGLATLAVGAGLALRSGSPSTPSQRAMELTEALTVDAELGAAQRTVAPVMMANLGVNHSQA